MSLVAALLVAALVAAVGQGAEAQTTPEPDTTVALDELAELIAATDEPIGVSGEEAVELLDETGTTDLAADNAGMPPEELVEELVADSTMFVTADAMVGYLDMAPPVEELTSADALASAALPVPPGANVFDLNSRPSSTKVIYIDVDGHVTSGDFWNTATGISSIVSAPYVNPATATAVQRDAIYDIWQRVSEDYLPFDVNVTTRDPGVEGLRKSSGSDQRYGQRVVITPSNQWVTGNTLGIALLDVFARNFDHAAFVFATGFSARVLAEAVSHEAGHTFGLNHDGTAGSVYYDGHGSWAPIMGQSTSSRSLVTQWSRGEYANANNEEDDIAKIWAYTGWRQDDHAGIAQSATLIDSNSVTAGVIGAGGDTDVFAVDAGPGTITATVRPSLVNGTNLHASVTVRDPSGNAVSAQPVVVAAWTSRVTVDAPAAGRYTIEVRPTSWLTPVTGFSTYGSMGAYVLEVSETPSTVQTQDGRFTNDANSDGKADVIALRSSDQTVYTYFGNGAGGFTGEVVPALSLGAGTTASLVSSDWNGDGRLDIMTRRSNGDLFLSVGIGDGTFSAPARIGNGWQGMTAIFSPGDWDGDGNADLLARLPNGRLLLYRGNGAGGFAGGSGTQVGNGWQTLDQLFSPGDFTGDGHPDVIGRDGSGRLRLYSGNGSGGWLTGSGQVIGSGWQAFVEIESSGDFDGDARADVLAYRADGRLCLYLGNGASSWLRGNCIPIGRGWQAIAELL